MRVDSFFGFTLPFMHKTLNEFDSPPIPENFLLYYLAENNKILDKKLKELRKNIKAINSNDRNDKEQKNNILQKLIALVSSQTSGFG